MASTSASLPAESPGLTSRRIAFEILAGVIRHKRALDDELAAKAADLAELSERDRALIRNLVATALRRLGTLRHVLGTFLQRGLPQEAPQVEIMLLIGATQILLLDVPDHAAVDLSVRLARADRHARNYSGLVNAVLRRVAGEGRQKLATLDTVALDTPAWLMTRWTKTYGTETARRIAAANGQEPALDLSVKSDPELWAERLSGRVLPTGSVRVTAHGPISALPGYEDGAWWVQDAAAALPATLFGDLRGLTVADLCAAPGGKTVQLALAGAKVTAVDRSAPRLVRLAENLARLGLAVDTVTADATQWQGGPFDAILLDAPCSSTGTIRRHPDIPWLKHEGDLQKLVALQSRLLDHAATLLKPGGTLVYCTCSLEREEGEDAIAGLLERNRTMRRRPVAAPEISGQAEFLTPDGDVRTYPFHWPDSDPRMGGLDGFYAARLQRI